MEYEVHHDNPTAAVDVSCGKIIDHIQMQGRSTLLIQQPASAVKIYTAPSLEGGDDEYKKVISGKVDNNKPSFA